MRQVLLLCGAMSALSPSGVYASDAADSVYLNGRVYTVNESQPWAQAVAIKDGRFVFVGSDDEARKYVADGTQVIDLHGRMAMPGLTDAHVHMLYGGVQLKYTCMLPQGPFGKKHEKLVARLKECATKLEPGDWLSTGTFLTEQFPDGKPERKYIDAAFPNTPIFMRETTFHNALANGKALELAGVTESTPNPAGGAYVRDAKGRLTGELIEKASSNVGAKVAPLTPQQNLEAMREAIRTLHSLGVTSVQDALTARAALQALHTLEVANELTIDVSTHLLSHAGDEIENEALIADRRKYASRHVDTNNIKMTLDGTPTGPYYTEAGYDTATHQVLTKNLLIDAAEVAKALQHFDAMGMRVKMHVAGAGSSHVALDAIEAARKINPHSPIRHELAHSDLIIPEDMDRIRTLNATADMSPAQWQDIGQYLGNPPQRAWRFKTLAGKGVLMTVGSDWPVIATPTLWPGLQGMLEYGDESIELPLAIKMLTLNPAISAGRHGERGSIEVGKMASFIVLDRHLFEIPVKDIGSTNVMNTIFEGEVVFDRAASEH